MAEYPWAREEFLVCRDLRHAWSHRKMVTEYRQGVVTRTTPCMHGCGCVRIEEIVYSTGARVHIPTVKYPKGYLIPGNSGESRITPDDFRRMNIRMTLKPDSAVVDFAAAARSIKARKAKAAKKRSSAARRRKVMR